MGAPFNSIFSWLIKKRVHQIELFKKHPFEVQQELLSSLLSSAADTEFGKSNSFSAIRSHEDFKQNIPLQQYDQVLPYVERLKDGEQNLLWPGEILWFAKSSGTTNQRSKLIPVSRESLQECHYKGGKDLLGIYYNNHPNTRLFTGKHLIVGGSSEINYLNQKSYFGDLSAIIVKNLPWWCEWRRTPSRETALLSQWEEKIDRMAKETIEDDVRILAGVPSWTLVLLKRILEENETDNIFDIWPNLELYMHGGVSFTPYQQQFEEIMPGSAMNFVQTYNASEGFFGIQDLVRSDDMLLMLDYGVFYEFIPKEEWLSESPETILLDQVEIGTPYEMVISTNAGLWRYRIGDVIEFTNKTPFRFKIIGRTAQYINVFGEELMIDNVEKALTITCDTLKCSIKDYTVCPIFMTKEKSGGHEWLIEFDRSPISIQQFSEHLDVNLQKLNSDYAAKRSNDLSLQKPLVRSMKSGTFYDWLKSKNKLGGQNKIPRLQNDRKFAEEILFSNNITDHSAN
ncbi:MAG: GH3 auxin-responsive promoter family protein [Flavobacteriales bacterium]|nr:GH3 auxin-responsive promoter family protein [Flavobacteriales bacterium]MCB9196409.1 GH3 auxin-responsive promoter family protein [Flavobacteriales bacterium]MCB9198423.1 GH3 auxin-responsive promoter family protein [Flavobacteriales bacterium]